MGVGDLVNSGLGALEDGFDAGKKIVGQGIDKGSDLLGAGLEKVGAEGWADKVEDLGDEWASDLGATPAQRAEIRARIDAGQSPATTYGNPLYPYGAGLQGW